MFPNGSSIGPTTEPSAVMRSVWPFRVRSPLSVAVGPSIASSTESKRISGYCSASKNSGDCRWATRFSSLTTTESTGTEPVRVAAPFSSTVTVALIVPKLPRNVDSMCFTAKPAVECTPSLVYVPAGIAVAVVM